MNRLFLRKSVQDCENDILERGGLKRSLGKWHLTALGVGATIGAGIFATTGTAIVGDAAPARRRPRDRRSPSCSPRVTCGFAALCYAEFAAMVPISGSAYTYAYASLGELVAWIIGWDLIVEYAVGNIGVAIGWSGYFRELLSHFGLSRCPPGSRPTSARRTWRRRRSRAARPTPTNQYLASALTTAPAPVRLPVHRQPARVPHRRADHRDPGDRHPGERQLEQRDGAAQDRHHPVLLRGGRHADQAGATGTTPPLGGFAPNGFAGISAGAAIIFFSYIGFDADQHGRRGGARSRRGTCRSASS